MSELTPVGTGLSCGHDSNPGQRATQEDRDEVCRFRTADGLEATLALVADGIGGRNSGEMASQLAKEIIPAVVMARQPAASEIPRALVEAFRAANARIYRMAAENAERAGMGTTCTAVVVVGYRLYLAHVGDTRAYVVRGRQALQLTIDHTWAQEALEAGRDPEEIRVHPNRGVIKRYLGITEDVNVDTRYVPVGGGDLHQPLDSATKPFVLQEGDSLFLCSDGLSDLVADDQMAALVGAFPADGNQSARELVQAALKVAGAGKINADNVTAVVIDLPGKVLQRQPAAVRHWTPLLGLAAGLLLLGVGAIAGWAWFKGPPPASSPSPAAVSAAEATGPSTPGAPPKGSRTNPTPFMAGAATPLTGQEDVATGPTATPLATSTAAPDASPTATGEHSTPAATPRGSVAVPVYAMTPTGAAVGVAQSTSVPVLLAPPDGDTTTGTVTFRWNPVPLPAGAQYEVVVWDKNEPPSSARGVHAAVSDTSLTIDITGLFALGTAMRTPEFNWTVLVVDTAPYLRLLEPSNADGPRRLTYTQSSRGGSGGPSCTGPSCGK